MKKGWWLLGGALTAALMLPSFVQAAETPAPEAKWLSGVAAIAAGEYAAYAVKQDGTVWAWGGSRGSGLLGNGSPVPVSSPVRMHIDEAQDVAAGSRHALILKRDGTVWATGSNEDGQLGIGKASAEVALEPVQVDGLTDIVAVAADGNESLALQRDGTVWQWGRTDRVHSPSAVPTKVDGLPPILAVSAGAGSAMGLGNGGEVRVWGTELTDTNPDKLRPPTQVSGLGEAVGIAASGQKAAALLKDGTVRTWRNTKAYPNAGQLLRPAEVRGAVDVVQLAGGSGGLFSFRKADGTVWMWDGYWDQPEYAAVRVSGVEAAVDLAGGGRHQYALLRDGTVMAWSVGPDGKPGDPKRVEAAVLVVIGGKAADLAVPPLVSGGVSYVPLRGVFEHMGATVQWVPARNAVVAGKGDTVVEMDLSEGKTTINGRPVAADLQPMTVNDVTMVPLRFIAEALGAKVTWDPGRHAIRIDPA